MISCWNLRRTQRNIVRKSHLLATHMLVFMVRGVVNNLSYPYAHFPTKEVTAELLFGIVWEEVRQIEILGLRVLTITCDGAAVNRKFFRMDHIGSDTDSKVPLYKTRNPYSDDEREIYFICDVPHLLKTTRNCWSHSYHGSTRRCMAVRIKLRIICLTSSHSSFFADS